MLPVVVPQNLYRTANSWTPLGLGSRSPAELLSTLACSVSSVRSATLGSIELVTLCLARAPKMGRGWSAG